MYQLLHGPGVYRGRGISVDEIFLKIQEEESKTERIWR